MMLFRFPAFWISVSSATIQNFQNTVKMICTINAELLEWFMHNDKKAQHFVIFMWICQMFWMFENFDSYLNSSAIRVWGSSYDIMPNISLRGRAHWEIETYIPAIALMFFLGCWSSQPLKWFLILFDFLNSKIIAHGDNKYSTHHIMKSSQHTCKSERKYKCFFTMGRKF